MKDNTAAMETLQKATEADVEKKVRYTFSVQTLQKSPAWFQDFETDNYYSTPEN